MKELFEELFDYNNHFNREVIILLKKNSNSVSDRSLKLISHIVNAHQVWNCRILKQDARGIWDLHRLEDLGIMNADNYSKTQQILSEKRLSEVVEYMNSKGKTFSNSLRDILFHVINHSTYHRAQIATECRQSGIEPLVTDYIFYKRE